MDMKKYENKSSDERKLREDQLVGHLVVSSCPTNTGSKEELLCEGGEDDKSQSFLDNVPATFVSNGIHFANKFCAFCHGINDEELLLWDIEIKCLLPDEEKLTLEQLKSVLIDDCFLQYTPPKSSVLASKYISCRLNIVRSCNKSGTWDDYMQHVEDLCKDPLLEDIYLFKPNGETIVRYNNVFCALCNGVRMLGESNCVGPNFPKTGLVDFGMILSFSTDVDSSVLSTETDCPLGHTFISLLNECMKTRCSSPMAIDIFHNTCVPPEHKASTRIDLALKITIDRNISLSNRAEFEKEILRIVSSVQCLISFAYELEPQYHSNVTDIQYENFNVVYVCMSSRMHNVDHQMAIDKMTILPFVKNISLNGLDLTIVVSNYETDSAFFG